MWSHIRITALLAVVLFAVFSAGVPAETSPTTNTSHAAALADTLEVHGRLEGVMEEPVACQCGVTYGFSFFLKQCDGSAYDIPLVSDAALLQPYVGMEVYCRGTVVTCGYENCPHLNVTSVVADPCVYSPRAWYVLPDSSGDAPTIQAAIDSASMHDTVIVSCGTYYEHDIELKSGIILRSETGMASCVTIDADGLGRVLYAEHCDTTTRIAGFTLRGGNLPDQYPTSVGGGMWCLFSSPQITNCDFVDNAAAINGGGLFISGGGGPGWEPASPTITNCNFINNSAQNGGGVNFYQGAYPYIANCIFTGNTAEEGGGMTAWSFDDDSARVVGCSFTGNSCTMHGGGLFITAANLTMFSNPVISNCDFEENTAGLMGGAICCFRCYSPAIRQTSFSNNTADYGGGIGCDNSSAVISDCVFEGNSALVDNYLGGAGGALYSSQSQPPLTGCVFDSNYADNYGGAAHLISGSHLDITGCVFSRNTCAGFGGAILCNSSSPHLTSCTFAANSAVITGGGLCCDGLSSLTVERTIIAFSTSGGGFTSPDPVKPTPVLECVDIYGNTGGDWTDFIAAMATTNGNFSLDPEFCDADNRDFRVMTSSPCAASNNSCGSLIGALESGCGSCCGLYTGGYTGNIDCDVEGLLALSDITTLIAHIYLTHQPLCCPDNANVDGDAENLLTLSDITRLIDNVYINHTPTAPCP